MPLPVPDAQGLAKNFGAFFPSIFGDRNRTPSRNGPKNSDHQDTTSATSSTPDSHSTSAGNNSHTTPTITLSSASSTPKTPTSQAGGASAPNTDDTSHAGQTSPEIKTTAITVSGSMVTVTSTISSLPATFGREVTKPALPADASYSTNNAPDGGLETLSINSADTKKSDGEPHKGINVGGVAAGASLGVLFLALGAFLLFRRLRGKSQSASPVGSQERHLSMMRDPQPSSSDHFQRFSPKVLPIHKESFDLERHSSQIGMAL